MLWLQVRNEMLTYPAHRHVTDWPLRTSLSQHFLILPSSTLPTPPQARPTPALEKRGPCSGWGQGGKRERGESFPIRFSEIELANYRIFACGHIMMT